MVESSSVCDAVARAQYWIALFISNINVLLLICSFCLLCFRGGEQLKNGERCRYKHRWVPYAASTAIFIGTFLIPLLLLSSPIKEICPWLVGPGKCTRPSGRLSTCKLIDFGYGPGRTAPSLNGEPLGMPSGHSAIAGAFAVVMACAASAASAARNDMGRATACAAPQALGAVALALLTAWSRMHLRCHTFWQVLLGGALGGALGLGNCGVLRQL
jgi:membrane-associated phospholipid phosphatase